jgi:hypothetical protein
MKLASSNLNLQIHSLCACNGLEYILAQVPRGTRLAALGPSDSALLGDFEGEHCELDGHILLLGSPGPYNAAALRRQLSFLQPHPLGLCTSAGLGDRIGPATPGQVRAIRAAQGKIAPIFAQQSIREMSRTDRTPQQVMDDATDLSVLKSSPEAYAVNLEKHFTRHLKPFLPID